MPVRERIQSYLAIEVFKLRAKSYASEETNRKLPPGMVLMFTFSKYVGDKRHAMSIRDLEPDGFGAGILRGLLSRGNNVGLITCDRREFSDNWVLAVVPANNQLPVKTYTMVADHSTLSAADGSKPGAPRTRWLSQGFVSHLGRLADAARSAERAKTGRPQPVL